jgi:16S rRNA (cytidine1402-2'-O)-methyltransferase
LHKVTFVLKYANIAKTIEKNERDMPSQPGKLFVVATPIGNLQDMTLRAIEVLKSVDKIAAEDTRHSGPLLKHFGISKPSISLHNFNEADRAQSLLQDLQDGLSLALISDAGTPLISDPGYRLVSEAKAAGIEVIPIPGACAAIAALSAAGLPSDRFVFEGFLPVKEEARQKKLTLLKNETRTILFYEAPHRLLSVLKSMMNVFGANREVVVARELTKIYESIRTNTLEEQVAFYEAHPDKQKGEIVILVRGVDEEESIGKTMVPVDVLDILLQELPVKQAAALASKITGERKNTLYEIALSRGKK